MTGDETPAGARVEPPGGAALGPASADPGIASPAAVSPPDLKPCPFCGARGELHGGRVDGERAIYVRCSDRSCASDGPFRHTDVHAAEAWNAAPRLADGLRPEAPSPPVCGFDCGARLLLEALARDQAETRRFVVALASAQGVDLTTPPSPKRKGKAL